MPRNNGVYTLPPVYFAETGETIQPNQHNIPLQDIAQALTQSLPRDGTAAMTGDLPMAGRKVTGLGSATAPGDAVRFDQLPQGVTGWLSSVSDLTMAADRFPYATSPTAAALAVLTSFARTILAAAAAGDVRTILELGDLATKDKAAISDIDASGTASAATYLRGDGAWSSVPSVGVDQTWQNVAGSRTHSTSYQNNTSKPIMVSISTEDASGRTIEVSSNNSTWVVLGQVPTNKSITSFIVPVGWYYRLNGSSSIINWSELR